MEIAAKFHRAHPGCNVICHEPLGTYTISFYRPLVGDHAMMAYACLINLVTHGQTEISPTILANFQLCDHADASRCLPEKFGARNLARLATFGMIELTAGLCLVATRLPTLDAATETLLPSHLQRVHRFVRIELESKYLQALEIGHIDTPIQARQAGPISNAGAIAKPRGIALSLMREGASLDAVEEELARHGVHPSLISYTARWAMWSVALEAYVRALPPKPHAPSLVVMETGLAKDA